MATGQTQVGDLDDAEVDSDDDSTETDLQAYEEAKDLSNYYDDIKTRTLDGNVVKGYVQSINTTKKNGAVSIQVDVPAEPELEQFTMEKPKVWSDEYEFVRWVEYHGYSAEDFAGMIKQGVQVEVLIEEDSYGNSEYELFVPEYSGSVPERVARKAQETVVETVDYADRAGIAAGLVTMYVTLAFIYALSGDPWLLSSIAVFAVQAIAGLGTGAFVALTVNGDI